VGLSVYLVKTNQTMITKDILVEDLVEELPKAVLFLREKGLVCILCGEPVWGTLNELAKSKNFSDAQIDEIVTQLNELK
jgi:methionine synthase II (cobalamin-independent)